MNHLSSSIARKLSRILGLVLLFFIISSNLYAQDGKALFMANCASCHSPKLTVNSTGPALADVEDRWNGDRKKLHAWVLNSQAVLKSGDKYANALFNQYGKTSMTAFQGVLDEKQIDAVLDFIKKGPETTGTEKGGAAAEPEEDYTLLFGIITLILAIIVITLSQINRNLKTIADQKDGVPHPGIVPFWRNKVYIAGFSVILFAIGGFYLVKGAINLGRQQDYEPRQPIFYSHKVHAGVNQINCQYCHIGVYQEKQATLPSVNVCMNCHKAINEYTGKDKLFTAEGEEVSGTNEIHKLYKYAGFNPDKPNEWDPANAKPIDWVRIHNLPGHVYFNHSQHVNVGQVACQTCHGDITQMDEVKQFASLGMGWCVNCHRTTQVQFQENGFYSIYKKYHQQLKDGSLDSTKGVTVEMVGGIDCQKCHY
ncbi:MAG: c-type cytochrome [Chitinophagaceae bacterium]|jgi:mono/diheme cytochrome c family protein|nr:c-type cytochrome [Chitinophagaceae bacterium]